MSQEKFKLPRSSYEELTKIIKAYGQLNDPASLSDVSHLATLNKTIVSSNNAFLVETAVIEGGNQKSATEKGKSLALALMHEIPDEIQLAWRAVIESSEFLNKMLLATRIRRGMDVNSFVSHVAFSSGEKKSGPVLTGARTIIDIIRASGLVRQKDDKIIPVTEVVLEGDSQDASTETTDTAAVTKEVLSARVASGISITIDLHIDAKPSELNGLGKKIKTLVDEISSESTTDIPTND